MNHEHQRNCRAFIAFGLFCIASSASYILNDINDVERDRTHPTKRHSRPLAAGTVSLRAAVALLVACYAVLIAGWFCASPSKFPSFFNCIVQWPSTDSLAAR